MIITIVGLGVIGGSFAKAFKDIGITNVYGIDIDIETLKIAKELELIEEGYLDGKTILPKSDLVIFSLYPKATVDFIESQHDYFKDNAILIDTTGIKEHFIQDVHQVMPDTIDFVFTHPMAGREDRGIAYSDGNVFKGANFLITPTERNKEENIELVEDLAKQMGFSRISRVTPAFHDQMISFTSQLPHAIAVALMNSDHEARETGKFTGDSYPELTRIAKINEDLWAELFLANKDNLLVSIADFENQLQRLKYDLLTDNIDDLKKIFTKSKERRLYLESQLDERKRNQRR